MRGGIRGISDDGFLAIRLESCLIHAHVVCTGGLPFVVRLSEGLGVTARCTKALTLNCLIAVRMR